MNKFIASQFIDESIKLDGNHFENCTFTNCEIVFKGTSVFNLVGCRFNHCRWKFEGPAANTMNFLKIMYKEMGEFGKQMVEATFENIKK